MDDFPAGPASPELRAGVFKAMGGLKGVKLLGRSVTLLGAPQ